MSDDRAAFEAEMKAAGYAYSTDRRAMLYADGETLFVHADRRIQRDGRIAPPGLFLLSRQCEHEG